MATFEMGLSDVTATFVYWDKYGAPPVKRYSLEFIFNGRNAYKAASEIGKIVAFDIETWPREPKVKHSILKISKFLTPQKNKDTLENEEPSDPFTEAEVNDLRAKNFK
ncbi:hypothetical protein COBT_001861 [Conglomerata obtusa]